MTKKSSGHEVIRVQGINVFSICEHHLLPFYGIANITYVPNKSVVGISKFARIVSALSRRLQVILASRRQGSTIVTSKFKEAMSNAYFELFKTLSSEYFLLKFSA